MTLAFASPSQGAKVNDSVDISFTGTNLAAVRVLRLGRPIATATVSPDGRFAVATIETTAFRDGLTVLSAWGWGAGHSVASGAPGSRTKADPRSMLNLAVGGPWAGRYGVDVASFPTRYDIDHVRVYQQ